MSTESLLTKLSKDIGKLVDFNDEHDVIIKVGVTPNNHEFKAHSLILRARSQYFYTALSSDWARNQENIIKFEKPNISPDIFDAILRYIYNGTIELEDQELSNILDLLCAADELMIDELLDYVQTYLIQNKLRWIDDNLIEILNITTSRTTFTILKNFCLEEITLLNPSIFESETFLNMDESSLVALLERDDLGMSEPELWDCVLKWGITNTPSLSYNKNIISNNNNLISRDYNDYEWTSEDFDALEKTLKNCIPLIRFFHISPDEFYTKIKPYSKIISKELLKDIINYHLTDPSNYNILPPRKCNIQIDSKLLNPKQAAVIASWINDSHELHSSKSIPYTFKLLYRASVDNPSLFHEKCDNVGPTIVIVKIRDNNCLVGGYNSLDISWKRSWFNSSRGSKECFIFSMDSFINPTTLDNNVKLSKVKTEYKNYSIYDHPWDGICFGTGPDLWVNTKPSNPIGYTIKKCYQSSIMKSDTFYWEDWEVFSVQSSS
ncbi:unnamed protein product [Rhizophagus irregularis]|uniref:Kelch-like protein 17 n=1 Tax=Rhizophagus irregularis TaxID=588596 RepID=A0A2I1G370_9GLOM|nr:hypothetical protein RhiirA4_539307 [Rhizophagus irregularis]CAB4405355.1 unnamed protein product [Rhizophagus irregularis]CAB4405913.1 unnamed protein product [Rhizophagus irregularis]